MSNCVNKMWVKPKINIHLTSSLYKFETKKFLTIQRNVKEKNVLRNIGIHFNVFKCIERDIRFNELHILTNCKLVTSHGKTY